MKRIIAGLLLAGSLTGCAAVMTPAASSIPVDSAEIAKSKLLGESCMTWYLFFGPFGSASIKEIMDQNAGKKITLIDHKVAPGFFVNQRCNQVYGY